MNETYMPLCADMVQGGFFVRLAGYDGQRPVDVSHGRGDVRRHVWSSPPTRLGMPAKAPRGVS